MLWSFIANRLSTLQITVIYGFLSLDAVVLCHKLLRLHGLRCMLFLGRGKVIDFKGGESALSRACLNLIVVLVIEFMQDHASASENVTRILTAMGPLVASVEMVGILVKRITSC